MTKSNWIQLESGFYGNRKTLRLKRAIGEAALWIPPRLWCYCADNRSADISSLSNIDLADVLGYQGDAEKLRVALTEAGFLCDGGNTVSGWEERYAAKWKFYEERAKTAAAARWGKSEPKQDTQPVPPPNPPERKEEKQEKRGRVDQIKKHDQASLKDATSMLLGSDLPKRLTIPEVLSVAKSLKCTPSLADRLFVEWRDRKAIYRDFVPSEFIPAFCTQARAGGYKAHLLHEKKERSCSYSFDSPADRPEEPPNWREAVGDLGGLDGHIKTRSEKDASGDWQTFTPKGDAVLWSDIDQGTQQFLADYIAGKAAEPLPVIESKQSSGGGRRMTFADDPPLMR